MPITTPRSAGFPRLAFALIALLSAGEVARAEELDSVMFRDPEIPVAKVVKVYPKGLVELWLAALDRPERETQSRAALAIAAAHEGGMPGLAVAVAPLIRLLDQPNQHAAVQAAAARALAVLDAKDAAPAFLRLAKAGDPDIRDVVELALARWDHKPARELWLERIGQPPPHGHAMLLALRCIETVRDERAATRLRELTLSADALPSVRLAAARALGEIRRSGSEADAARLAADATPRGLTGRLAAAAILRRHEGAEATKLLQKFAQDAEPAVAVIALARLSELDTKTVLPVLMPVLASPDGEVRGHGVEAMFRNPSDEYIKSLVRVLSDPHPDVRIRARVCLRDLAGANWQTQVIENAVKSLTGNWRGQEQAAILLGQLGHKPAAARFVELLKTDRGEVIVAAAWGLRQLAVPETLPKVLEHVRTRHAEMLRSGSTAGLRGITAEALDQQLSQLVQFMGQSRYLPADAVLRALVPRLIRPGIPPVFVPVGPETRTAAVWALGLFHEGKPPDAALVALIEARLTGDGPIGRDDERVRRMVAVSLGRMQAKQSLEVLREYAEGNEPSVSTVPNACRWAINKLTGEPIPPPGTVEVPQRSWFLVPVK